MRNTPKGSIVVKGGLIVDQLGERSSDVVVEEGHIVGVGPDLSGDQVLEAKGCVVAPGFVDLHTHLRQPGMEEAETIESGGWAAVRGGFSAVVAMPNTDPPIDCAAVVQEVLALGAKAPCEVYSSGAITVGRKGEQLAPIAEMAGLGVRLFTDDGNGIQSAGLMRRAMEYAAGLGVLLAQHCEVDSLAEGGHMHEGEWSSQLGIPGVPAEAEELMVMRDIALSRLTGAPVHFQHLSTRGSVAMVRAARQGGVPVTAEAATHHFTLTDEACAGYDPVFKVNPPLRPADDVAAVREGLADGALDAIATDHAPHSLDSKERPFDEAPPGMLGLETALALALSELNLSIQQVVGLLSWQPAAIAGLQNTHGTPIAVGAPANLCVFDPEEIWTVEPDELASRACNTPYAGRQVQGRVRHTLVGGNPVVVNQQMRQ
ncbi:MAG: dihydroorotase [Acidimicrobiia bacterium]|nr:dihydroorotase [Acidimicrobiia bacterium]MYC58381.1 dihydroorotase [Acidimicrobiia bacterium]MYG94140.1 dihydroorotase [Acidimicrobiia bacterium]MYI30513.1 dihydroorotase [Acidimicrobiia bacterium]